MKKLDDEHRAIRYTVKEMRKRIKSAEIIINKMKAKCKHPNYKLVNYMWAPGHIEPNTKMCTVCGEILPNDKSPYIIDPEMITSCSYTFKDLEDLYASQLNKIKT